MANWISSKLKAAETILQQIDQQAAESLKKNEKPQPGELQIDAPARPIGSVSLKDQLKKRTQENSGYTRKLQNADSFNSNSTSISSPGHDREISGFPKQSPTPKATVTDSTPISSPGRDREIAGTSKPSPKPKATLTDSDWTELLSTPTQSASTSANRSNAVPAIRGLKKDGRKQGGLVSNLSALEGKRSRKINNVGKSGRRSVDSVGNNSNGKPSDGEGSSSSGRASSVDVRDDVKNSEVQDLDHNQTAGVPISVPINGIDNANGAQLTSEDLSTCGSWRPSRKNHSLDAMEELGKVNGVVGGKKDVAHAQTHIPDRTRGALREKSKSTSASRSSVSDDLRRMSSTTSGGSSGSETDSGSSSDSESEREREERKRRREKILAERAAAKAVDAIKERENTVAKLEGEKQSLEKILEEQARQQAKEASELQSTMMKVMDAAELEKEKHKNTRMEALECLAKLETLNTDLSRSLATAQKKLQVEIDVVVELRQQIEFREVAHEELRRRISGNRTSGPDLHQLLASKGVELELELLENEYSLLTDKIRRLHDKETQLEENIKMTRKEMEEPAEVEVELKRRLGQLTDHLIQKQAQVEALSSEKATLLFRIETVSRMLAEGESMNTSDGLSRDLELGKWDFHNSNFRPLLEDKFRSGKRQLGSLLKQLDAIFVAGAVFLRRNPTAKLLSLLYLVCLHFWVLYIFMAHSRPSDMARSGAVVSLENINNTTGV